MLEMYLVRALEDFTPFTNGRLGKGFGIMQDAQDGKLKDRDDIPYKVYTSNETKILANQILGCVNVYGQLHAIPLKTSKGELYFQPHEETRR